MSVDHPDYVWDTAEEAVAISLAEMKVDIPTEFLIGGKQADIAIQIGGLLVEVSRADVAIEAIGAAFVADDGDDF